MTGVYATYSTVRWRERRIAVVRGIYCRVGIMGWWWQYPAMVENVKGREIRRLRYAKVALVALAGKVVKTAGRLKVRLDKSGRRRTT